MCLYKTGCRCRTLIFIVRSILAMFPCELRLIFTHPSKGLQSITDITSSPAVQFYCTNIHALMHLKHKADKNNKVLCVYTNIFYMCVRVFCSVGLCMTQASVLHVHPFHNLTDALYRPAHTLTKEELLYRLNFDVFGGVIYCWLDMSCPLIYSTCNWTPVLAASSLTSC